MTYRSLTPTIVLTPTKSKFKLLALPPELRERIFQRCLDDITFRTQLSELKDADELRVAIFKGFEVNHQLREETLAVTLRSLRYYLDPECFAFLDQRGAGISRRVKISKVPGY